MCASAACTSVQSSTSASGCSSLKAIQPSPIVRSDMQTLKFTPTASASSLSSPPPSSLSLHIDFVYNPSHNVIVALSAHSLIHLFHCSQLTTNNQLHYSFALRTFKILTAHEPLSKSKHSQRPSPSQCLKSSQYIATLDQGTTLSFSFQKPICEVQGLHSLSQRA
jgi:hypothetical protein